VIGTGCRADFVKGLGHNGAGERSDAVVEIFLLRSAALHNAGRLADEDGICIQSVDAPSPQNRPAGLPYPAG
jgi:hypothetical protein